MYALASRGDLTFSLSKSYIFRLSYHFVNRTTDQLKIRVVRAAIFVHQSMSRIKLLARKMQEARRVLFNDLCIVNFDKLCSVREKKASYNHACH